MDRLVLLTLAISLFQPLGAVPPAPPEASPTDRIVITRKGIEISGSVLRLPVSATELEALLGSPDRSEELTNRILVWDELGVFAYEDPRSGSVHGIAFRYSCEDLTHCPAKAYEGSIRAGRTELPRDLDTGYLKRNGFKDEYVFWSRRLGKYEIFVDLEGGRLVSVEVDIDWDSPPLVAGSTESEEPHQQPAVEAIAVPTDEAGFEAFVRSFYDFHPHTMSEAEISAKSTELNAFWARVKSDPIAYLPLLRRLLSNPDAPSFFNYDGSKLLLALSEDRADQELVLEAIPRCELRDVQHLDYLRTVVHLAGLGLDTSEAGLAILVDPEFEVFVVEHALRLGQDFSLALMLLPLPEPMYLEKVLERLSVEKDSVAQQSLLLVLWYTVTDSGDEAIARFAGDDQADEGVRGFARDLLSRTEELERQKRIPSDVKAIVEDFVPKNSDFNSLKQIRRGRLNRISDEALYELDALTTLLRMRR